MARRRKLEFDPANPKFRTKYWASTVIGTRVISIYLAENFGAQGIMEEQDTDYVNIFVHKAYLKRPQAFLDTLIHELTHVVELVYFQQTVTPFGYGQAAECNPAVKAIGTGLAQAFTMLHSRGRKKHDLLSELGLFDVDIDY